LALKANIDTDKLPLTSNPLYDKQLGTGKGMSSTQMAVLTGNIGNKIERREQSPDQIE